MKLFKKTLCTSLLYLFSNAVFALDFTIYLDNNSIFEKNIKVIDTVCNVLVYKGYIEERTLVGVNVCVSEDGLGHIVIHNEKSGPPTIHELVDGEEVSIH